MSIFATSWAWVNYSWLASAYDNDDVLFRLATLVEMVGVIILALGIPQMFASLDAGGGVNNSTMVAGYVVMRVAAVFLWLRAARHDPAGRRACLTYAATITIAQVGWVALIVFSTSLQWTLVLTVGLAVIELLGPVLAERKGEGTPWHPHHLAERYSLLVIITLGEVILGTVLAVSAVIEVAGWSVDAALTVFGGTALAFGLWWLYFTIPSGALLARHRGRAVAWGYGHIPAYAALVAVGVGLHVAAATITGHGEVSAMTVMLLVAGPVLVFEVVLLLIHFLLLQRFDGMHAWLLLGGAIILGLAIGAVAMGASVGVALFVVAASPGLFIAVYETVGYRREDRMVRSARQ